MQDSAKTETKTEVYLGKKLDRSMPAVYHIGQDGIVYRGNAREAIDHNKEYQKELKAAISS